MAFHLLNPSQKFAELTTELLITNYGLSVLKNSVTDQWNALNASQQKKWEDAFAVLGSLMPFSGFIAYKQYDEPNLKRIEHFSFECYDYGTSNGLGMVAIEGWRTQSEKYDEIPDDMCQWGWDQMEKITPYTQMIGDWIAQNELKITFNSSLCKRAKSLLQKKRKGELIQVLYDPTQALAEVNACVVFTGGGYLDAKGSTSPLAGARMFESAGSALTTIRSRKLKDAVVVNVKTSIEGIDPQSNPSNRFSDLDSALAAQQNKRLKDALENLSREQLLERLKELEDKLGEQSTIEPPVRKSKM